MPLIGLLDYERELLLRRGRSYAPDTGSHLRPEHTHPASRVSPVPTYPPRAVGTLVLYDLEYFNLLAFSPMLMCADRVATTPCEETPCIRLSRPALSHPASSSDAQKLAKLSNAW